VLETFIYGTCKLTNGKSSDNFGCVQCRGGASDGGNILSYLALPGANRRLRLWI